MLTSSHVRLGVSATVFKTDGRILLVQSTARGWGLPGGFVEFMEWPLDALQRELSEEAAIRTTTDRYVGLYATLQDTGLLLTAHFCGRHTEGIATPDGHEIIDTAWFSPREALSAVQYQPHLVRLQDSLDQSTCRYAESSRNPWQTLKWI